MNSLTVRVVAAGVLTCAGAACGRSLAASRRLRVAQLEALIAALARLRIGMVERLLPLREALAQCGHPALDELAARLQGGASARAVWPSILPALRLRGAPLGCLIDADAAALAPLFDALGATGLSGQRLLLAEADARLQTCATAARKAADEQARLYTSLGLLIGLTVAILLI